MASKLWRLLRGYVIIKIKGPRPERFLNRAARARLKLWRAERMSTGMLVTAMSIGGFRRVRSIVRRQGWKVAVVKKAGLPFLIGAMRMRRALIVGMMLAVAAAYVGSGFIWFIQIDGDEGLPGERILSVAAAHGLRRGVSRDAIDRHRIQQALLLDIDELSWTWVHVAGVMATVEAVTRSGLETGRPDFGDLVAARDGIVTKVVVFNGQGVVEEGATVKRGDVLISGFIPPTSPEHRRRLEAGEPPYIRADGSVIGRVWYEGQSTVPLVRVVEVPTGRKSTEWRLLWGESGWSLGRDGSPFETYREDSGGRVWTGPMGSIGFERIVYTEVTRDRVARTRAQAEATARAEAMERLVDQLDEDQRALDVAEWFMHVIEVDGVPAIEAIVRIERSENISVFQSGDE